MKTPSRDFTPEEKQYGNDENCGQRTGADPEVSPNLGEVQNPALHPNGGNCKGYLIEVVQGPY